MYQRHLSPVKGFRCAHAVATGGPSCSDVALEAFRHYRFSEALQLAEGQFASCRTAYMDGLPDAVDAALRALPDLPGASGLVCGGDSDCCQCFPDKVGP
jgi:putative component of membrane protein insertase Oxa1/YidC/SpoIIIJ protein YidD